jgi:hypothetical protein
MKVVSIDKLFIIVYDNRGRTSTLKSSLKHYILRERRADHVQPKRPGYDELHTSHTQVARD